MMNRILRTTIALTAALAAVAATAASSSSAEGSSGSGEPARSADLLSKTPPPLRAAGTAMAGPGVGDVGDVDSFGRSMQWLGIAADSIELAPDCTGIAGNCQLLPALGASASFGFEDIAHISLPGKASHSLLCYWFSPVLTVSYNNPTASPVVARFNYSPSLTLENPVLDDPSLIDPTTGAPFGGKLVTGMTASEHYEVPLPAGLQITERTRDSAVCIAGLISRSALVESYGLSEAQAKEFFKRPTTVRLNVQGGTQYVESASLYFGLRIVGD